MQIVIKNHNTPKVEYDQNNECYCITFQTKNDEQVSISLSSTALRTLAMQCLNLMPNIEPTLTVATIEEAYRIPARIIKYYDDRSIRTLLCQVEGKTLVDFLWYMKDGELMKKFLNNLSGRAAVMLMDDLNRKWRGYNPDKVFDCYAKQGRNAVSMIMETLNRLIEEGSIESIEGKPEHSASTNFQEESEINSVENDSVDSPDRPSPLSDDEIASLLASPISEGEKNEK